MRDHAGKQWIGVVEEIGATLGGTETVAVSATTSAAAPAASAIKAKSARFVPVVT